MRKTIYAILEHPYGKHVQGYMPLSILNAHEEGHIKTEADLARHIWYTTTGGTTAAAKEISRAIPGFVTESDLSTW